MSPFVIWLHSQPRAWYKFFGKKATVCMASHLQLTWLCVVILFLCLVIQNASTLLVYDRQTLFNIWNSVKELIKQDLTRPSSCLPLFFSTISVSLHWLSCIVPRKTCCPRCGKHGGISTRFRVIPGIPCCALYSPFCPPKQAGSGSLYFLALSRATVLVDSLCFTGVLY